MLYKYMLFWDFWIQISDSILLIDLEHCLELIWIVWCVYKVGVLVLSFVN